ncbi:hypothetical protein, partial [Pseudoalteromonas luteoviolacea]|uniref:hypothetical protein n=2 Tax=Pseudoalteromonas luteoviolacea TaxID=43657 RepID=UPI000A61CD69
GLIKAVHSANDGIHGQELWVHDDKTGITSMVTDLSPGASGGLNVFRQPWHGMSSMAIYDGDLYFSGKNALYGEELWKLEGTTEEVTLVADILPGADSGSPHNFTVHNGKLYFSAEHNSVIKYEYLHSYSSKTNQVSKTQINYWNKDKYVHKMESINGTLYVTSRGSRITERGWFEGVFAYDDKTDVMTEIHTNGRKTSSASGGTFGRSWFTYYLGSIFYTAYDRYQNRYTQENKIISGYYEIDLATQTSRPLIAEIVTDR